MASALIHPTRLEPFPSADRRRLYDRPYSYPPSAGTRPPLPRAAPSLKLHASPATPREDCERLLYNDRVAQFLSYETSNSAKAWRAAQWVVFFLLLAFIATIVVMMAHAFEQMQTLYTEFSGSGSYHKLTVMLDNAAAASGSFTEASRHVLEMAQKAHQTLDESVPVMTTALNRSAGMVDSLSSFSAHPQMTISAGEGSCIVKLVIREKKPGGRPPGFLKKKPARTTPRGSTAARRLRAAPPTPS